jgi:phosphatidylglycerophosphatase A
MAFRDHLAVLIATWGGIGRSPVAPGTMGSLAAMPLAIALQYAGVGWHVVGLVVVTLVGWWAAEQVCQQSGEKDPSRIVVDEVAGVVLTLLALPAEWRWWLAGLLLFRVLDISKPWLVGWCDRRLEGGTGVMADDLVAALGANLLLHGLQWVLPCSCRV